MIQNDKYLSLTKMFLCLPKLKKTFAFSIKQKPTRAFCDWAIVDNVPTNQSGRSLSASPPVTRVPL